VRRWPSSTSVATLLCALGAATLFLTCAEATVALFDPSKPPLPNGALEARRIYFESYPGYRFWHAGAPQPEQLGRVEAHGDEVTARTSEDEYVPNEMAVV